MVSPTVGSCITGGPVAAKTALLEHARGPRLDEIEVSVGTMRKYPVYSGKKLLYKWEAKLPKGAQAFEGTRSKSASFDPDEGGELAAKMLCSQWLKRGQTSLVEP